MTWRNAIAHQDFTKPGLELNASGRTTVRLQDLHAWRSSFNRLALHMDQVVGAHVAALTEGPLPW